MLLQYIHLLDVEVRQQMVSLWTEESASLQRTHDRRDWPFGKQLTEDGWTAYMAFMALALELHDDEWLMNALDRSDYWTEPWYRNGKPVAYNRADSRRRLAMTEFNTAYVRGLATTLLERGQSTAHVYRAAPSREERNAYCSGLEGQEVDLRQLIADHRRSYFPSPGDRSARSIPAGTNCHHTIK